MKAVEMGSRGHSPLHSAAAEGHTETVRALLIANPDACLVPNQNGLIPLHLAARRGRIEVVQELVRACPASLELKLQGSQETVLHLCVKYNQIDVLKFLVKSMVGDRESLNSVDSEGNTIWQLALMMKQTEIIRFLASIPEVRVETSDFQDLEPIRQKHAKGGQAAVAAAAEPAGNQVTGYFENQRNAIEKRRGELMVVTTVIAAMAFQGAINPPGGVWQADTDCYAEKKLTCLALAGRSVLSYTNVHGHNWFVTSNTVCFSTSLGVIFLLIGLPLNNWYAMGLLLLTMASSIVFMSAT